MPSSPDVDTEVVVVGGGTAGSLAAVRLAQRGRDVVVVEAGPGLPLPPELRALDASRASAVADRWWPAHTLHEAVRYGGLEPVSSTRVGRGIGGSGAVNYLVVCPGDQRDYEPHPESRHEPRHHPRQESLHATRREPGAVAGNRWPEAVLRRLRSAGEWLPMLIPPPGPLAVAFGQVVAQRGDRSFVNEYGQVDMTAAAAVASHNLDADGYVPAALAATGGQRWVPTDALTPNTSLDVLNATVTRILVEAGHGGQRSVRGVELADGRRVHASRVVLCAGSVLNLPLLARSGLLPPSYRAPERSHLAVSLSVDLGPSVDPAPEAEGAMAGDRPLITALHRWNSGVTSHPHDLMTLVVEGVGPPPAHERVGPHPASEVRYGNLILMVANPSGTATGDLNMLTRGIQQLAGLVGGGLAWQANLRVGGVYMDSYGTSVDTINTMSDSQIIDWIRMRPAPVSHLVGTCEPLVDLAGGGQFTLVNGLSIADGSVLPSLPTGTPQVSILALVEGLLD